MNLKSAGLHAQTVLIMVAPEKLLDLDEAKNVVELLDDGHFV